MQLLVPLRLRTHHQGSGQHIPSTGETFGEGAEYQVGVGKGVDVQA